MNSHTQLLSSNIMGYRMHQDKEYTRQGRAEQRMYRRVKECRVGWSRVFWSRVVLKEVQRVT